jgi:hypothetical protein
MSESAIEGWSGINYLKDYERSRELAAKIVDYYKGHPAYPKNFYKQIETEVYRIPGTKLFGIRSNLSELFANIVDLERKYNVG